MAHDVAGAEEGEDLPVLHRWVVHVHDHRHAGGVGGPDSPAERLEPVLGDDLLLDAHLHPEHHVAVLPGDPRG